MKYLSVILIIFTLSAYSNYAQSSSLSLDEALKKAMINNYELIKSGKEVDAARGRFWNSISLPQPKLSLSHEFVPEGKSLSFFQEKTFEISQEMEFPTNLLLKGSRSNYEIDLVVNEKERVQVEVISKVKLLYNLVLIKGKMNKLAEENYKIAKDFFDKAEARRNAGEGTKLESITAKMQLNEAGVTVESSKKDYYASLNDLLVQLNSSDLNNKNITLSDTLAFNPVNIKLDDLLIEASQNNSLLKKSANMINIASINKSLAWSGFLPSLSFSYFKQATADNSNFYGFSFGISVPVWFMFEQRGQIEETSANYQIAREEGKSLKNSVELNLKNAFTSFSYEQEQIKTYTRDLLPQAEEVFNLARLSYNSGEINYVEYLQAKQNLISVRNNYFNSLSGYFLSLSTLETVTGKLIR